MKVLSEYDVQAKEFVGKTNIELVKTYTGHNKHFADDKERRSNWHITVKRGNKSFSYDFGQSIMESYEVYDYARPSDSCERFIPMQQKHLLLVAVRESIKSTDGYLHKNVRQCQTPPTDYSLLSCMSSDSYCADTFDDWCGDFGYDTDSRKALDTFLECQKIASDINRFFTEAEIEQLQEIQ